MRAVVVLAYLQAIVLASPMSRGQQPKSKSKGFKLVAKVTEPETDFEPSVNRYYVSAAHGGAGRGLGVLDAQSARIWYLNGTTSDILEGKANTISDGGDPPFPSGFRLAAPQDEISPVRVDMGSGTPGVQLTRPSGSSYPYLTTPSGVGSYIACNEEVPYYGKRKFSVLKYAAADVPKGCAQIDLIPQCAELPEEGSLSREAFAQEVRCYDDISPLFGER
ncbi:hypothetical protein SODALDRAFT_130963 [Sodiomyces alkalinus F11]|uniref:DUF7907 domain-containing protein n=1 Tax=Sodiomyces alkalinus (strain CBS 110278 / VKM F-3762 / F11) TaxID=1314773 RepID=A0A3N2PY80_SODAK|nr:hypothetical protein SODALDRAFT_130963 [Sodiomyces alkalinus F11]ROT39491.1 hypothetical protein SODALDRAFT_130963 [Sodiomyces alkalinus F11]